jgi:hypothetical protein
VTIIFAISLFLAIFIAILFLVISVRPMPLTGVLAPTFAALISFETGVMQSSNSLVFRAIVDDTVLPGDVAENQ